MFYSQKSATFSSSLVIEYTPNTIFSNLNNVYYIYSVMFSSGYQRTMTGENKVKECKATKRPEGKH